MSNGISPSLRGIAKAVDGGMAPIASRAPEALRLAADEIERLTAALAAARPDREGLREALEWIAAKPDEDNEWDGRDKFRECRDHARDALEQK